MSHGARANRWLAPAALAAAVLGLYSLTLGFGLIEGEDRLHLDYVAGVLDQQGVGGLLSADYRQDPSIPLGYYRPVILVSFAVEQALASGPWLFHLSNVLVHLANSLLVLWLLRTLFRDPGPAMVGALIFALHPIQTECVAFVAGRTDLWTAIFLLPAAIAWARVRGGLARRPALETAAGAAALGLAILCKEVAFALPAALLAWEIILPASGGWRLRLRRSLPPWLGAWGVAIAVCLALRMGLSGTGFGPGSTGVEAAALPGVTHSAWLALGSALTALKLLVWPWPMNVAYLDASVQPAAAAVMGAGLLLVLAGLASGRAAGRGGLLGLAWMGAFLLPVSGLVPLASYHLHERFLYIPSIGVALITAGLAQRTLPIRGGAVAIKAAATAVLAAFALATLMRLPAWRDDESLWSRQVAEHPGSWVGHFYLARHRLQAGEVEAAVAGFTRTLALTGDFAPAWLELGLAHSAAGRHRECLEAMLAARRANPRLPFINANVAVAYRNLGRRREAAEAFEAELRRQPASPRAHYDLAAELLAAGEPEAALGAVDGALSLAPGAAEPRLLRGLVLLTLGRRAEANAELQRLRQVDADAARRLAQAMAARPGGSS